MRVFYYCFDHNRPTGGIKQIYRHVDILRRHGCEAFVLHDTPGARATWFENQTPVIDRATFAGRHDPAADFVVLPEDLGARILDFPGRKVVFNQNVWYGFAAFGWSLPPRYPYLDPEVVAALAVSDHNREYLRFAYPRLEVLRVWYGVDAARFTPRPLASKDRAIACAPKALPEVYALLHLLQSRARQGLNRLGGYDWVLLQGKSEAEVAALLNRCRLLLFLSTAEGLGLLPLEAMLSGCLVAAYAVGPPREYLPPQFQHEPHDLLGLARWVEALAEPPPSEVAAWQAVADAGRATALRYGLEREEESVLAAWARIRELGR
ncbi:MAG TPA: glycosyltransferase [Gemmataceae bacterium]|nr:glycosyltransferase [Gemmataceae bacterium]